MTLLDSIVLKRNEGFYPDRNAAAEAMIPNFLDKHLEDLTPAARPIYEAGPKALAWKRWAPACPP